MPSFPFNHFFTNWSLGSIVALHHFERESSQNCAQENTFFKFMSQPYMSVGGNFSIYFVNGSDLCLQDHSYKLILMQNS